MLSRVADSLYWMSRYLERAEHLARVVDVHLNLMLEVSSKSAEERWKRVLKSVDLELPEGEPSDAPSLTRWLTFDLSNGSSIVSCIMSARENARQVREQISSEMWEQLNRLFHEIRRGDAHEAWDAEPMDFLHAVKDGVHLFQGITDTTMSHGHGWQFIKTGRYLERAKCVSAVLDEHFSSFPLGGDGEDAEDHMERIALLRSCTAFEAYCKAYTADLQAEQIAEFLLLNNEFPHSVRFSVDMLQGALADIDEAASVRMGARVERLAGKLKSSLDFSQIDEIIAGGLHSYLKSVEWQCGNIHAAMYQLYITYPIEALLET